MHLKLNKDILSLIKGKKEVRTEKIETSSYGMHCFLLYYLLEYRGNNFNLDIQNLSL